MVLVDRIKNSIPEFPALCLIARRFPKSYVSVIGVLALLGYSLVLMFPWMAVEGAGQVYRYATRLMAADTLDQQLLIYGGIWLGLALLGLLGSYRMVKLKFAQPRGLELNQQNAPALLNTLQSFEQEHVWPKINRVVLTQNFELDVVKTPVFALPVWSRNHLVIGYSVLQALDSEQLHCLLHRRLLQNAKRTNPLVNFLAFSRQTWKAYAQAFKGSALDKPFAVLFGLYADVYSKAATYVAQQDELLADDRALNSFNDESFLRAMEMFRVSRAVIASHFWPKLEKAVLSSSSPASAARKVKPFTMLPRFLQQSLTAERISRYLGKMENEQVNHRNGDAPFALVLHNMGHAKAIMIKPNKSSAADAIFGTQKTPVIENMMNKLWLSYVFGVPMKSDSAQGTSSANARKNTRSKNDTASANVF